MLKVGIIGGTGLEKLNIFKECHENIVSTIYGYPSSGILEGTIHGVEVAILSRHGRDHSIPPSQINNRANIQALKNQGCTHILVTTACGSLREHIHRGDMIFPDQFIDWTKSRKSTFYEEFKDGDLKHTPMSDPFDNKMRQVLIEVATEKKFSFHPTGTVITIEGPRFSTRAESNMFRFFGADIINMSTSTEAALANEAGIPYAAIALSTDYDCWKTDEEPVTWEAVLEIFAQNVANVTQLLVNTIKRMKSEFS